MVDKHYTGGTYQPIQFMQEHLTKEQFEGAMLFNIIKYASRFGKKDGESKLNEARKIRNYAVALYTHTTNNIVNPEEQFI